jgi:mercuric ion binding protein
MIQKTILSSLLVVFLFTSALLHAQKASKGTPLTMKTSGQCEMCKDRLETAFAYEKGVFSSSFDLETKDFTVYYNPKKTDPDKLRKAVNAVGYDADDTKADPIAYSKLPGCCRKPDDPARCKH